MINISSVRKRRSICLYLAVYGNSTVSPVLTLQVRPPITLPFHWLRATMYSISLVIKLLLLFKLTNSIIKNPKIILAS